MKIRSALSQPVVLRHYSFLGGLLGTLLAITFFSYCYYCLTHACFSPFALLAQVYIQKLF